jgi:hypothetical protein
VKAKFRVLKKELEQLFIGDAEDIAIIDTFDGHSPRISRREKTDFAKEATGQKFHAHFCSQETSPSRLRTFLLKHRPC